MDDLSRDAGHTKKKPQGPQALGVGIVWWPALDELCRPAEGLVDVIEAEPESFWVPRSDGQGFRSYLGEALAHLPQPKILHGVGGPLAGTCPSPPGHEAAFAADIARLRPAYVSEHLNFSRFLPGPGIAPASTGFLLPPRQSRAGVALAAQNIRRRRAILGGVRLAVETPVSYLPPHPSDWTDGEYVASVAEEADCDILLDLHNVLCNARNGRQPVEAFCEALPPERVCEVHLAGGEMQRGFHLDAHSSVAEERVMEIAAHIVPRLPRLRAIVFEIMPERVRSQGLPAIARQLSRMRDLWNRRGACVAARAMPAAPGGRDGDGPEPEAWEALLGCALNGLPRPELDMATASWWHAAESGIGLYRMLAGEARASAVAAAAPRTARTLLRELGAAQTRRLLVEFWHRCLPQYTAADEARAFLRYLAGQPAQSAELANAMRLDTAMRGRMASSAPHPHAGRHGNTQT